jgi:hypothetical protein
MRTAMSFSVAAVAALGFAACATPPAPAPAPGQLQCVAGAAAWAVGQPLSDDLVNRVIADTHSRTARVVRPGQAVTMDFRGDRVNVMLDMQDKVDQVTCG